MKLRRNLGVLFGVISLILTGCGDSFEPAVIVTTTISSQEESGSPLITEASMESFSEDPQPQEISENTATINYVGIKAHIKEIHEDRILISSDTDGFPGAFWVLGARELAESRELESGNSIFILMEDLKEKESDGIKIYRAKQLFSLPGEEGRGTENIVLTDVPTFTLTDVLSSKYDPLEIHSGNYLWNLDENGEGLGVVACGCAPLEEAAMEHCARLKLPTYSGIDYVGYSFSTKIQPDKLVVRQWPKDMGKPDVIEESITTYYYVIPFLDIKPDKIYEFAAEWEGDNQEQRKFSGRASYVLVTE